MPSPQTSHCSRPRRLPHPASQLDSVAARRRSPVTSSVLTRRSSLRLLNVVPPASSVPATTVLPVLPATVNLFDEIASDPSDAVTANFPLFTSTSPATSSVLDSVAAPVTFTCSTRRSRHIQRARQRRSSRAQAAQRSPPGVQRPRHHRVARVASHRELVRRNRQRPVRCRHRKLPTVHVHVACHIQRARQRRRSRAQAAQRRRSRHVQCLTLSPPPPCCPCCQPPELVRRNRRVVQCVTAKHCSRPRRLPHPACSTASHPSRRSSSVAPSTQLPSRPASPPPPCCPCCQPP